MPPKANYINVKSGGRDSFQVTENVKKLKKEKKNIPEKKDLKKTKQKKSSKKM